MSELHASPALRRFVSMSPHELMEARRRVMARPLIAASINAQSGFEPAGIVTARIVGRLMAHLQKGAA